MIEDNIKKLRKAYEGYTLNHEYEVTEKLLKYIEERIKANEQEIEELIKIRNENIKYVQIEKAINEEINEDIRYKEYRRMYINKENFISTSLLMPIGVIAVEAFETTEVVRYFIKAIKTRNAIAISDVEYDEQSVKFLIMEIIKEALKKFNINENLIMILPFEECYYKYFDRVIYTYDKNGESLKNKALNNDNNEENIIESEKNKIERKTQTNKKYVYIENKDFESIAKEHNRNAEILYGNIDEVIEKINEEYSLASVIYTKNPKNAYRFINLVQSQNVLVNASTENAKETILSKSELLEYKNIIIPIPQGEKQEDINTISNKQEKSDEKVEELSLTKVNQSIIQKIKNFLKSLFGNKT